MVDSLIVEEFFYTDSLGIFRANFNKKDLFGFDSTIEINTDGFRDREFGLALDKKPKILLLGDSFCWGASARPITKSFADRLETFGYEVFNTGIPCVDPIQYQLIAHEYIPKLKPEVVVLTLYMGNDLMHRDIKLYPYANRFHLTNAGWMDPYLDGDHIRSPEACYQYYLKCFSIPKQESTFNRVMAQSVVSTQLWTIFRRLGLLKYPEHREVIERKIHNPFPQLDIPITAKYLQSIKEMCDELDIRFHICIIPLHTRLEDNMETEDPLLFRQFEYHWPTNLVLSDYNGWPDGHFNNSGHRKYALFLNKVIRGIE